MRLARVCSRADRLARRDGGRHKLILSPEEEFALSKGTNDDKSA
jgi:hypothetical protein